MLLPTVPAASPQAWPGGLEQLAVCPVLLAPLLRLRVAKQNGQMADQEQSIQKAECKH